MLKKFAVTNYRGFSKRIELDLGRHNNYEFNTQAIENNIIKNGIVYGPNGSGKSNLSLALFDIVYHLAPMKAKKPDYFDNYVYAGKADCPVCFEYTFQFADFTLAYNYAKDGGGNLVSEELYVNGESAFRKSLTEVIMDEKFFPQVLSQSFNSVENANNVSVVNFLLTFYPLPEKHFLILLQQFVNRMLWFRGLDRREFVGIETRNDGLLDEYIISNGLVKDFENFLNNISGQDFVFAEHNKDEKTLYYLIEGKRVPFFDTASTGTTHLELLYFWIKRMNDASFVFIDEFDAFYHYQLAFNVCKWLFELPCQLFLSSHNTYLMANDLLRPDCNFILKDKVIKSLAENTDKELRQGHNIEKLYRGKAFES